MQFVSEGSKELKVKQSKWIVKKWIAILLAVSIAFGTASIGAFADEPEESINVEATETVSDESSEENSDESSEEPGIHEEISTPEEVQLHDEIVVVEEVPAQQETKEETPAQQSSPEAKKEKPSDEAKKDVKSDTPDPDSGDGDPEPAYVYTTSDVDVNFTYEAETPADGAQNKFKFNFKLNGGDGAESYSAFVYGNGVDEAVCRQLAAAYYNGLIETKTNNKVIKDDFTDAEKHSDEHDYVEGYDSNLCWAYAASDALWQSGWVKKTNAGIFNVGDNASIYFQSEDDLASYAAYCLNDVGGAEDRYWKWFINGESLTERELICGPDEDDGLLNEYYTDDMLGMIQFDDVDTLKELLSGIESTESDPVAATVAIYFFTKGGHALSLTGFIRDEEGNPVAVIVTDPDNGVRDESQPDDPKSKSNVYGVYPIEFVEGKGWVFKVDPENSGDFYFNARIGDISVLDDSEGKEKVNESRIPEATRGISDEFDNDSEYDLDSGYGFDVPFNLDFLSFYDINKLKYRLFGEDDDLIEESAFEISKSEWKQMIADGITALNLSFRGALENLTDGKYKVEVEVDKECFEGNYGWFAKRYDNGNGYFDRLVNVWVNLFRPKTSPAKNESNKHSSDKKIRQVEAETIEAAPEASNNAFAASVLSSASASIGMDLTKYNPGQVREVMSTAVSMTKAGKLRYSGVGLRFAPDDVVFALIYLADGTTAYVKANILSDGSIEFSVPANVVAIRIFSVG